MPQLWLTYQELAEELECDASRARDTSILCGWTRKHSRDGQTRVLLPDTMTAAYMVGSARRMAESNLQTDSMVEQLRKTLAEISARHKATPPQRLRSWG